MENYVNQANNQTNVTPKRLFVYGSLMEGFTNYENVLKDKVNSSIFGKVKGVLYHLKSKGYPAMIHGEGWVSGEFLELENFDELISSCDEIEKYFFERRITEVKLSNGKIQLAWVYWYARNDLNSNENPVILVSSGDWREFMRKNTHNFS